MFVNDEWTRKARIGFRIRTSKNTTLGLCFSKNICAVWVWNGISHFKRHEGHNCLDTYVTPLLQAGMWIGRPLQWLTMFKLYLLEFPFYFVFRIEQLFVECLSWVQGCSEAVVLLYFIIPLHAQYVHEGTLLLVLFICLVNLYSLPHPGGGDL